MILIFFRSPDRLDQPLRRDLHVGAGIDAGQPYIATVQTTLDKGKTSGTVYAESTQTIDAYGNVLTSAQWDYSATAPSGTANRTYTNTYKTYKRVE